jgi:hypothetical protein
MINIICDAKIRLNYINVVLFGITYNKTCLECDFLFV